MVVRDLPLSVQQHTYFKSNNPSIKVLLVNSDRPLVHSWSDTLKMEDMIVLTAQVLLNNLEEGCADLSQIDFLVC